MYIFLGLLGSSRLYSANSKDSSDGSSGGSSSNEGQSNTIKIVGGALVTAVTAALVCNF
jgi:hypothetical protein